MRLKRQVLSLRDKEEATLRDELRDILNHHLDPESSPPVSYVDGAIARLNQAIDIATSGKAISLSWAARVAIPGVIAIISFFIGLHYYVPETPSKQPPLSDIFAHLPIAVKESLSAAVLPSGTELQSSLFSDEWALIDGDEIVGYLVEKRETVTVLEILSDEQIDSALKLLRYPKERHAPQ